MTDLSYIVEPLRPLAVSLDDLTLDPKNARTHEDPDLAELAEELKISGQDQAILVQKDGMIVRKGNGRVMAARKLGWTHIAAVVVDISEKDGVRRALVDNRIAERSRWNNENLLDALDFLEGQGVVLDTVGFDDEFMASLLAESENLAGQVSTELPDGAGELTEETTAMEQAQSETQQRGNAFKSDLVFDSKEDRAAFIAWTRELRKRYPDAGTTGAALMRHIREA